MLQEFAQQMKNTIGGMIRDMHTAIPGKILAFDAVKCEAQVQPYGKYKKPDGTMLDYAQISGVPVLYLQGSGQTATIVYSIKPGDECLLLFSEQALDTWQENNAITSTDLKFDMSNAIAIVGLFARPNTLVAQAVKNDSIIIDKDGQQVEILPNEIKVTGTKVTVNTQTATVTANTTTLNSTNINAQFQNLSMEGGSVSGMVDSYTLYARNSMYWQAPSIQSDEDAVPGGSIAP